MACLSVNDAFVMSRWIKSLEAEDKVTPLADGGAAFAQSSGLAVMTGNFGGPRLGRLAMIVSRVFHWLFSGLMLGRTQVPASWSLFRHASLIERIPSLPETPSVSGDQEALKLAPF